MHSSVRALHAWRGGGGGIHYVDFFVHFLPFVRFLEFGGESLTANGNMKLSETSLMNIAQHLSTEVACRTIAMHLLRKFPGGGAAVIDDMASRQRVRDWNLLVFKILVLWCETEGEEATGAALYHALRLQPETRKAADFMESMHIFQSDSDEQ